MTSPITYGSVCSGIEAATVAWHSLGWKAAWFAEIEAFPSAVLAHHYPDVQNLGDMTQIASQIRAGQVAAPDVLVGGTPCQAFSIAGLRGGMSDARGQLTLSFVELANEIDRTRIAAGNEPCVITWENVPGVLSSKDNAFGCFLAALCGEDEELQPPGGKWANAGYVSGPQRTVAWRILDAQYFGVAQRRRRVFVVASARNWFDPASILFESEGVRRDIAPRRSTGQEIAGTVTAGAFVGGAGGRPEGAAAGHFQPVGVKWPADVACTLNASFGSKLGLENQHINSGAPLFVPALVAYSLQHAQIGRKPEAGPQGKGYQAEVSFTMDTTGVDCVAYGIPGNWIGRAPENGGNATEPMHDMAPCLTAADRHGVSYKMAVRRLMPVECERLQAFPDGYTSFLLKNKQTADTHRYKALGNSMCVNVMRWIGRRIDAQLVVAANDNIEQSTISAIA